MAFKRIQLKKPHLSELMEFLIQLLNQHIK
jgi:hypothetical protein